MNRRGSILIMFLWTLVLFSLLAMSVASRARLASKIRGQESGRFERLQRAFNGVNLARYFLENDESGRVDSPLDVWYGTPKRPVRTKLARKLEIKITDEESKLNINRATPEMLLSVLQVLRQRGVRFKNDPKTLASALLAWRGVNASFSEPVLGRETKNAPYESMDELLLVPGLNEHDAALLTPFITVYGQQTMGAGFNLNTVHPSVLEGIVMGFPGGSHLKAALLQSIERYRGQKDRDPASEVFLPQDLDAAFFFQKLNLPNSVEMKQIVDPLLFHATVDSRVFTVEIRSEGRLLGECVLGPLDERAALPGAAVAIPAFSVIPQLEVLAWHENLSGGPR